MDDIKQTYLRMADEELLVLFEELDSLTDGARNALLVELRNRNLHEEAERLRKEREGELPPPPEPSVTRVTVASFEDSFSANLAKGKLESEGIEAFLATERRLTRSFGEGHSLSQIELQVKETDVESANGILREVEGGKNQAEDESEREPWEEE